MVPNFLKSISKKCTPTSKKLLLIPLATLGIIGLLFNPHVSLEDIPGDERVELCQNLLLKNGEQNVSERLNSMDGLCYPKTNVVFLKTHKCAGSTVQNILMRYGDNHKLNFVLPRSGNYLGHPAPFSRTMVGPPKNFQFNILAHHTRLDYKEIKAVMPPNSIYITIVRDPIQIFESSFYYYDFDKMFNSDIHTFIKFLPKFQDKFLKMRFRKKFGSNQMFFDLGGDPTILDNEKKVLEYIDKLESWFHFALVAERMDESLVLLRHLLCWQMDDVVVFKLNARNPIFKSNLSDTEKEGLINLNHADSLIYNRFLKKFEEEVKAFGEQRMASETAALRERTLEWYQLCVSGEQPHPQPVTPQHYYNPRVMTFEPKKNISNSKCDAMTREELAYTEILQKRQMASLPKSFGPNRTRKNNVFKNRKHVKSKKRAKH